MLDPDADASRNAPENTPDSRAECRFKKVLVSGLPPSKKDVDSLMKSLEARGVLGPLEEAVAESGALATVLPFSSHRKKA